MRALHLLSIVTMLLVTADARGACTPIRLGYVNLHRPPYFLGNGSAEAPQPGAAVDLIRDIAASAGCQVTSVRLPPLRLRQALDNGTIDAMLMDAVDDDLIAFALPLAKNGKLDKERAVRMYTVVFVRAEDNLPATTDPRSYFMSHRLGLNNGASLAAQLRKSGYTIDDGAQDSARNLEKLVRGRIDGYGATMVSPTSFDATLNTKFGQKVVRLETPLRTNSFWLAFTKPYYEHNRGEVDSMWNWMGAHGNEQFAERVKQYEKAP
jgi:polar amino acid transport system substrate-binding protein